MEKERKLQIIKASVKRFDKHGPNKTTLDEIARDLRIGKATIYGYFKSKEELYFAALDWEGSLYLEDIKTIFGSEGMPIRERFLNYFDLKESIPLKYKLIQDTLIQIVGEKAFENEHTFFKNLLSAEEEIIRKELSNISSAGSEQEVMLNASEIVMQSWGLFLGRKISTSVNNQESIDTKNLVMKLINSYKLQ